MDQYKAEAKEITSAFFSELKGELVKAMKAGGPVTAISVCSSLAPAIAMKHSEDSDWDVYEVPRPLSSEVKVLAPPTALSGG